jgi:hypothetical protein
LAEAGNVLEVWNSRLAAGPDDAFRYWPVWKRINDVRTPRDDKTLIEPVSLEPALGSALLV